jgi:hypothetical protein
MSDIPTDAICNVCGHVAADHTLVSNFPVPARCNKCVGGTADHLFKPRTIAGNVISASREQEEYQRALRGGA